MKSSLVFLLVVLLSASCKSRLTTSGAAAARSPIQPSADLVDIYEQVINLGPGKGGDVLSNIKALGSSNPSHTEAWMFYYSIHPQDFSSSAGLFCRTELGKSTSPLADSCLRAIGYARASPSHIDSLDGTNSELVEWVKFRAENSTGFDGNYSIHLRSIADGKTESLPQLTVDHILGQVLINGPEFIKKFPNDAESIVESVLDIFKARFAGKPKDQDSFLDYMLFVGFFSDISFMKRPTSGKSVLSSKLWGRLIQEVYPNFWTNYALEGFREATISLAIGEYNRLANTIGGGGTFPQDPSVFYSQLLVPKAVMSKAKNSSYFSTDLGMRVVTDLQFAPVVPRYMKLSSNWVEFLNNIETADSKIIAIFAARPAYRDRHTFMEGDFINHRLSEYADPQEDIRLVNRTVNNLRKVSRSFYEQHATSFGCSDKWVACEPLIYIYETLYAPLFETLENDLGEAGSEAAKACTSTNRSQRCDIFLLPGIFMDQSMVELVKHYETIKGTKGPLIVAKFLCRDLVTSVGDFETHVYYNRDLNQKPLRPVVMEYTCSSYEGHPTGEVWNDFEVPSYMTESVFFFSKLYSRLVHGPTDTKDKFAERHFPRPKAQSYCDFDMADVHPAEAIIEGVKRLSVDEYRY